MSDPEIDQALQAIHQNLLQVYCTLTQKTLGAVRQYAQELKRARANAKTLKNLFDAASMLPDSDDEMQLPLSDFGYSQFLSFRPSSRTLPVSSAPNSSHVDPRDM